nr:CCA tRNA nucleotidyltransferase [uncultured Cohaesibacter sp.]
MNTQEPSRLLVNDAAFEWRNDPALQTVFSLINRDGEEVRVVGGAVRNSLLGAAVSDIDCATTAEPSKVMAWASEAGIKAIPTGIEHGTVTLVVEGRPFEITTLRTDVSTDGRHAEVAFGRDWDMDAHRRDFTMNALYMDAEGRLFDPVGNGVEDAQNRHVRFIGNAHKRIAEDYLRVLRFFRFFAQYGKGFEPTDYAACIAAQGMLSTLSPERVGAEMSKLIQGPFAFRAIDAMHKGGMLTGLLSCVPHLTRFARIKALAEELYLKPDLNLLLTALCVDVREDALRLAKSLRLPNHNRDAMARMAPAVRTITKVDETVLERLAYVHGQDNARDLVLLAIVRRQFDLDLTELSMLLRDMALWTVPAFPLNGRDLINKGMKPGPELGERLIELEKAWVSSGFALSKTQLLSMAKRLGKLS